jgi:hypothetical protein
MPDVATRNRGSRYELTRPGIRRETRHKAWASLHINGSHAGG